MYTTMWPLVINARNISLRIALGYKKCTQPLDSAATVYYTVPCEVAEKGEQKDERKND